LSLKRTLAFTLLVQGSGGLATLLAALWIGRALGPSQQGQFNQIKSLIELGIAIASLGMPQALYVFVQSARMSLQHALKLSVGIALLGIPAGFALALINGFNSDVGMLAGFAGSVVLACLYAQWRALILLSEASWRFNLVTVIPQWLLFPLAGYIIWSGGVGATTIVQAMALLWLLAIFHTWRELTLIPKIRPASSFSYIALLLHGLSTWAGVSLTALAVVILQKTALSLAGLQAVGQVSLALLLAQAPLTPLNYALPLLVRYRLRESQNSIRFTRYMPLAAAPMLLLIAPVVVLGQFRNDLWLGQGYAGLNQSLMWMLVAGAAEAMMRLVGVDTQAEGRPWRSACAEAIRVLVFLALGWWKSTKAESLAGAATVAIELAFFWAVATWVAAITLWALNRDVKK
jgi:O-antigen/teichoic acid export membrane protein